LPAYNLESSIAQIVERTKPFVDSVIVVADGSRDATGERARAAGAIVPEPENVRGKGFALRKGIGAALALAPEYVVILDSDGQHLPEEIPVLLEPLLAGHADLVSGSRFKGTLRTRFVNKLGNHFLRMLSFVLTGRWLSDTETGFRAFRSEKLAELPLASNGYEIESEIMMGALLRDFRIVEVPIHVPLAVPGVTVMDGFKVAWFKIRYAFQHRGGKRAAKSALAKRATDTSR
jgi:glycosyltransferase involved in cell wall biosynthesis